MTYIGLCCSLGKVISGSYTRCSVRISIVEQLKTGTWRHKHDEEYVAAEAIVGWCNSVPFDKTTCAQVREMVAKQYWAPWAERCGVSTPIMLRIISRVDGQSAQYGVQED